MSQTSFLTSTHPPYCSHVLHPAAAFPPLRRRKFSIPTRKPSILIPSVWHTPPPWRRRAFCRWRRSYSPISSCGEVRPVSSGIAQCLPLEDLVVNVIRALNFKLAQLTLQACACFSLRRDEWSPCNLHEVGIEKHYPDSCSCSFIFRLAQAIGRVLLSVILFAAAFCQPFLHRPLPAHAASSVNVTSQQSEGFYETLFDKFREKDVELGRIKDGNYDRNDMQTRLRKLYDKVREQKERAQSARRQFYELHKASTDDIEGSLSPYERRVLNVLDRTFEESKERLLEKVASSSYLSSYEDNLREAFDSRFASLKLSQKEMVNDRASTVQKTRELIDQVRIEERWLQAKVLEDMEKSMFQLKTEEMELRNKLGQVIRRHLALQEQLRTTDDKKLVFEKDLDILDSEIAQIWETMLNAKAEMYQLEVGSFQAARQKLPSLEKQLEETISNFSEERNSSPSAEVETRNLQEKVTKDLKMVLKSILAHRFLPEAIHVEEPEPSLDDQAKLFLDKLKQQDESLKQLIETMNKMIQEDIETEIGNIDDKVGQRNFVVAPSLQKMNKEKTEELKQFLKENPEVGHQYVAEKQERILKYRDRVLAEAWFDEKEKRWEVSPQTLKYAVDKELLESARIRHDRRAMYFKLKGDDRIFFTDIQVFDDVYVNHGGFNSLHLKMLGSGIPTSVEFMRIPFNQLNPIRVFLLPFRLLYDILANILKIIAGNPIVTIYFQSVVETFDDILGSVVFPALGRLPKLLKVLIGYELPDNAPPQNNSPFLMELKRDVEKRLESRYGLGESSTAWWISLPLKCFILWIPYTYVSRFIVKLLGKILGPGEEMNEVEWKQKKGKEIMKKLKADNPKAIEDPVRKAFDKMKRIKNPELRIKDFAGLDMIKDEINEIITFLRDPSIFKGLGARPPRGVLIVGQPGTGKSSLAMAIAAEARVPVVELNGMELEGGAWVGQGASNVRELFKTARELAPLIIFIDYFDYFAGVRGESGDTRKQDHESLINQLLVELDGFETQEGVVLIATCSRPDDIDEALRRPGRMDRTITLLMPNKVEREIILRKAAESTMDVDLIDLVDWKEMARKTNGMTPQQLKAVPRGLESSFASWKYTDDEELFTVFKWLVKLNNITPGWIASSKWMRNHKSRLRDWLGLKITKEDVEAAVACIDVFNESQPGIEFSSPGYIWTREFKFPHAVWAAGRGLVGALLPNFDVIESIWLDKGSWEGIGFTRFTKRREGGYEETGTLTRSYFEKKMVLCFGSSAAARLLLPFGEQNELSKYEIKEANQIASSMVLEFGWGPTDDPTIYASPSKNVTLSMGDKLEYELEAQARGIFEAAASKAVEMIEKNRKVLDALLEHLLQYDAISKQDLARLMKENGAIFEEEPFVLISSKDDTVTAADRISYASVS